MNKLKIKVIRKRIMNSYLKFYNSSELTVSIPSSAPESYLQGLLERKKEWIEKTRQELWEKEQKFKPEKDTMLILGETYKIVQDRERGESFKLDHNDKIIHSGVSLNEQNFRGHILKSLAQDYIRPLVWKLAREHNFPLNKLFIRGQVSKWGTCSYKGNVSINYKVMAAPPYVIRSVILHELTHLNHMNHGKQFKAALAELCPRVEEANQWLKDYNYILQLYD